MNKSFAQTSKDNSDNTLLIDLKYGRVVIEMLPEVAPNHVERIKALVKQKFYDGISFHRVIDGFMAILLELEWVVVSCLICEQNFQTNLTLEGRYQWLALLNPTALIVNFL
jgi:hypothetical protein